MYNLSSLYTLSDGNEQRKPVLRILKDYIKPIIKVKHVKFRFLNLEFGL